MASGAWTKNVLCRYFMNGICSNSEGCAYSHDPSLSSRRTVPCSYFMRGTCAYGDQCRFSHGQDFPPLRKETSLKKHGKKNWADAPEFVPSSAVFSSKKIASGDAQSSSSSGVSQKNVSKLVSSKKDESDKPSSSDSLKSYAQVANPGGTSKELSIEDAESQICPFGVVGECRYGELCAYVHGEYCDYCQECQLHPTHEGQRRKHRERCIKKHEAEMELAFAVARSKEKTCGICMEVIMEKDQGHGRFGIMPNCNHCFCLSCLRTWRQAKQFENKIVRSCPECRQKSDYICPSHYWVESEEDKKKLFSGYKLALNQKECKYFKNGIGKCPFGNKCFYKHASANGESVDVGPPQRRHRSLNGDISFIQRFRLDEILQEWDIEDYDPIDFYSDYDDDYPDDDNSGYDII